MDADVSSCFGDTGWTVAHPKLHAEVARRVHSRGRSPDQSDVVQEALNAAVKNRLLLKRLTPVQRSGWFWVVVKRLSTRFAGRRSRVASLLGTFEDAQVENVADPKSEEPVATLQRAERVALLRAEIAALPEPWRRALAARNEQPDDWAAAAAACGMTEPALRGQWYRAMAALRERLQRSERSDAAN